MAMDLEIIGRHALLFDDDASAAFVNSGDALVEWHSLQIDRYDVRHLLPAPPPSRRRNRTSNQTLLHLDEPSLQSQLDYERYLDLILQPDEPEIEEDDRPSDTGGYRAVGFSYGNNDSVDQNSSAALESSVFRPPFPIPEDLLNSLPPSEKVHQIIARTAVFVSKHGGQSEIILRVKQGDNPTFGFLMPGHHLHVYFRFLVEHPDLLHSDEGSHDEGKKDGSQQKNEEGIGGALSLLGSIYGSVEEEDNEDIKETEMGTSQDNVGVVGHTVSSSSEKADKKDESLSRKLILSNKEKVIAVKKNSLVTASKSGCPKVPKKEEKSGSLSAAVGKMKSSAIELASVVEPVALEPPHDLKRLIDKLVEFVVRNGKQFEATLIEQEHNDGRFPFLLPSNQYHPYYLQVLQAALESKHSGRNSGTGKANSLSSLPSNAGFIPLESDRKEKIKMVIGKSKKELEESESKATQHASRTSIDAATAAAILQAATRGIKTSNMQMISDTPLGANSHANGSGGDHAARLGSSPHSQFSNAVSKSDQTKAPLTEEQKLKAERRRKAKLFIATLNSKRIPHKPGTSRSSSVEPVHSGVVDKSDSEEKEGSLASPTIDPIVSTEEPERNYFDEHTEPPSKRKFRSRSAKSEDSEGDDEDRSRRRYASKSRRFAEGMEREDVVEREQNHHKGSHRPRSSNEIRDEGESDEEERDHKSHRSYHSREKDNDYGDRNHKRSRRKHHSHHSPRESSRKRHSSKQHSEEEDEDDYGDKERDHKDSRKKHRSLSHSRDKKRHGNEHSSRGRHHRKHHHGSAQDEHPSGSISDKHKKGRFEGARSEDGEISSRPLMSEDIATGHVSRETSVDLTSSDQCTSSQPIESSAVVPQDLRAKVRAMLMATRLT